MIYVIAICVGVYILAAAVEYALHLVAEVKRPWYWLRYLAGGIGIIVIALSLADKAGRQPEPDRLADNSREKIRDVSFNEKPSALWYIHHYSKQYGIDPLLVQAIIQVESRFDESAHSNQGAMGLMQINSITAKHLGLKNPFDVRENIEGGTRYLQTLLKRHYWDLHLALASYNAGPATVERFQGIPPYPETRRYVWKVINEYRNLKRVADAFKEKIPNKPRIAWPSDRKRARRQTRPEKTPPA
jgi:soluble lytic murein transglycosylase-like protein